MMGREASSLVSESCILESAVIDHMLHLQIISVNIGMSNCSRFEVMLLGKLQLKDDLPTQLTFIDEAAKKYHSLELQHAAKKEELKLVQNLVSNQY